MTAAVPASGSRRPALSARVLPAGWSPGDAWTVGIGLSLALVLAVTTIPAVLDARGAVSRAVSPGVEAPPAVALPPEVAVAAPGEALPPAEPPLQPPTPPLLGPLVPLAPAVPDVDSDPAPAPAPPAPAGAPPPAPGELRRFAALPGGALPGAVAADADGTVSAGTDAPARSGDASALLTWDRTGVLRRTAPVPEQPADRTRGLTGLEPLLDGSLAAVDAATSRLLRYDVLARSWSATARVPDVPPCLLITAAPCQPGVLDAAPLLRGLAVDATGGVYVADAGQGTIWRLRPGQQIEPWYSSADVAGPEGLAGLAVDADGHVLAVVTRLGGLQGTAAGALLRIERAEDGSAGPRSVVAGFSAGEDPVDVALGSSGSAYIALRGVDAVVTLDGTGFEQVRVVDEALKDPSALHLSSGRVLVASAGQTPAVLEIGVDDAPLVPTRSRQQEALRRG
jgi:hypothetical protein